MIDFTGVNTILWDFDGVIVDSMAVRDQGFLLVLAEYEKKDVDRLMKYHRANGGLSRYVKFRYFFETILQTSVSESELDHMSKKFSEIMRAKLTNRGYLIEETMAFIEKWVGRFEMHIVSGSDGDELRYLCHKLRIDAWFTSINGSPTPKIELVHQVVDGLSSDYNGVLIGDSKNDYEAARKNNLPFFGFNNKELADLGDGYIDHFDSIKVNK